MLSQERLLGGYITAEVVKALSSKDHPEMCHDTRCAVMLPAWVRFCQLSLTQHALISSLNAENEDGVCFMKGKVSEITH